MQGDDCSASIQAFFKFQQIMGNNITTVDQIAFLGGNPIELD